MSDDRIEAKSKSIFRTGSRGLEASPFLSRRIANEVASRIEWKRKVRWWQGWAIGGSGLGLGLASFCAWLFLFSAFSAHVGQPTLVEVGLRNIEVADVARVEIELPEGVTFVSTRYPEIDGTSTVSIPVEDKAALASFPFVVRSAESGLKRVRVMVFDRGGKIVEEKILKIRFSNS
ncbi:MAG: hypothetical protein C5B49_07945 [Bdellovibrio sp.]|nr:MAG: hypothetical protein C5B49_07945 [Bdellovibrio sp.]